MQLEPLASRAKNALVHAVSRKKIEVPRMETTVTRLAARSSTHRNISGEGCVTVVWNRFSLLIGRPYFSRMSDG